MFLKAITPLSEQHFGFNLSESVITDILHSTLFNVVGPPGWLLRD